MRIALFALIAAAVATPAMAQRMPPVLPFAPRGIDYVETVCTGGIDGRYEMVRVLTTGQVSKVTRRMPEVQRARATRGEVLKSGANSTSRDSNSAACRRKNPISWTASTAR